MAKMIQAGLTVLTPFGDNKRYDFVLDLAGKFVRVQVKTAKAFNHHIRAHTCSSSTHRGGKKRLYVGEADLFALYCPDNSEVYILPVDSVGYDVNLRLVPPRNGQTKGVKLAEDFDFNSWVAQLGRAASC